MLLDGRGALYAASGLKDAPMPAHYEPLQSVVRNELYAQQSNPALGEYHRDDNPYNGAVNEAYPHVLTTYRVTEMSGIMTRYIPWLAELQPSAFCEIDPQLAVQEGIKNGDWATISTAVGEIEVRVLVSGRMKPLRVGSRGEGRRRVHQIGIPYNYGSMVALARGDSVGTLIPIALDPNVSIHESKTLTCAIRKGRRPQHRSDAIDAPVPKSEQKAMGQPEGAWMSGGHGRGYQQAQGEDQGASTP
jgi:formate dehydrogenase major subunit